MSEPLIPDRNSDGESAAAELLQVQCACPEADAVRIAEALVEGRLAACVQCLPGVRSVYRWQGALECSDETLLLIKTTRGAYARVEATIRALHPYELPEILALPVAAGLPGYLAWVRECLG